MNTPLMPVSPDTVLYALLTLNVRACTGSFVARLASPARPGRFYEASAASRTRKNSSAASR